MDIVIGVKDKPQELKIGDIVQYENNMFYMVTEVTTYNFAIISLDGYHGGLIGSFKTLAELNEYYLGGTYRKCKLFSKEEYMLSLLHK